MGIIHKIPDWLIGLIVTLFFLFITLTGLLDFTESIERKAFDFRAGIAASGDRNSDIELVVITDYWAIIQGIVTIVIFRRIRRSLRSRSLCPCTT